MSIGPTRILAFAPVLALALAPGAASAQWTNRYPKVEGYSHHVYLEGYELPTLASGPLDAAPSPDGGRVALASGGWLWLLDRSTGAARQLTSAGGLDSRPAWSPDGERLAFVRDDGSDTRVVVLTPATGEETVVVDEPALDLDPAFGPDGRLYYSSGVAGTLDLWRLDPATGARERITEGAGIELRPQPHPDGRRLVYLAKRDGPDRVVVRDLEDGSERVLVEGAIFSQMRPALSPDGRLVAYSAPVAQGDGWALRLVSVDGGGPPVTLFGGPGRLPLAPAWSADGSTIYFSEARRDETMALMAVPSAGGAAEPVPVRAWNRAAPPGRLRVRTATGGAVVASRLSVVDDDGHPIFPAGSQPRFDGQTGTVFFYSPGVVELEVPPGPLTVTAARGLAAPVASGRAIVEPGGVSEVSLDLAPVWDAAAEGWLSGDHHFHLNYGGPYRLDPSDLELQARGEALDVPTPLVANLHNRFGEQDFWGWSSGGEPPLIRFGQEVRSHFLGHIGLLGTGDLFWPWVWGPGYQVYGTDDRTNATVLAHARAQGGMAYYVHPVSRPDPFAESAASSLPVELVADAVLGDLDGLEVVCLWSDERGTAEAWYRMLNLGRPVAPTAGTDVMTDFYRTMAIGTTRAYVHTGGATDFATYLAGLRAGRSFVTNGPLLDFRVEGERPGGVVAADGEARWTLDVHSAVPVDSVVVLVNGEPVWTGRAPDAPGSRAYSGTLDLPAGGWIAARVTGPATTAWPGMDSYAFAHSAPVWIGASGSTDAAAEARAAREMLDALAGARARLRRAYAGAAIPRLEARFDEARRELESRLGGG